jgi:hypothetical protein
VTYEESRFANSTRSGGTMRRGASAIALLALALSSMAVLAPAASAVDNGHAYSFSFNGPPSSPLGSNVPGIDVDNSGGPSAGDVYAVDSQKNRVVKFEPDGDFILMFGDEVNATTTGDICTAVSGDICKAGKSTQPPNGLSNLSKLTVDQVTGDVYLTSGFRTIVKYDEDGTVVASFASSGVLNGTTTPKGEFTELYGMDVNAAGELLVLTDYQQARVVRFTSAGIFQSEYTFGFNTSQGLGWSPKGFNYVHASGTLRRFDAATGASPVIVSPFYFPENKGPTDLEVDPTDGTVYNIISGGAPGTRIAEWEFDGSNQPLTAGGAPCATTLTPSGAGCPPTREFGGGSANDPQGLGTLGQHSSIGLNATTNAIYAGAQVRTGPGFESSSFRGQVNVYIESPEPIAVTGPPTANKTVSGTAKPDSAGDIVECWFEYGLTKAYGSTQPCSPGGTITADTAVSADLTLDNEKTYNYRLVVKNEAGAVSIGQNQTISPHNVLGAETLDAEEVKRADVKLRGSFKGDGTATEFWFRWGTTTSYSGGESPHLPAGSATYPPASEVSFTASGLTTNTLYHYQVVFQNANGTTFGNDKTFTTPEAVKGLSTQAPTEVLRKTAKLNGTFLGDASEAEGDIKYWFEWGKSTNYTASTAIQETTPPGTINTSVLLSGCGEGGTDPGTCLALETTYHYRLVAENELGITFGSDQQFTTLPAVDGITTLAATDIGDASVTGNGEFTGNGEATEYWFEYGPTTAYGQNTDPVDAGSPTGATPATSEITEFKGFTTYHYRLVAKNPVGTTFGQDVTFETPDAELPEPGGVETSDISATGATLNAEINPNRWATVYAFEYGTSTDYEEATVLEDIIDGNLNEPVPVSADISGLTPGRTYHVRVVAINLVGTAAGPDATFTTPDLPAIEGIGASGVTSQSVRLSGVVTPKSSPTTVHFEYGAGSGFPGRTAETAPIGADTIGHTVAADLSGLAPDTTYNYRIVATNGVGTTTSQVGSFTTAAAPQSAPPPVTKPKKCRKGFKKRKGKCIKRKKHRKKHRQHKHRGGRNG